MDILQINAEILRWLHSVLPIDHSVDLGLTQLMRHLHHLKETANINNGLTKFSIKTCRNSLILPYAKILPSFGPFMPTPEELRFMLILDGFPP